MNLTPTPSSFHPTTSSLVSIDRHPEQKDLRSLRAVALKDLRLFLILSLLVLSSTGHAQLPAGTTDAAQQTHEDPLRTQANSALEKQDYPAALKLLTTLADKSPSGSHGDDPHILYDLAFTQDALDLPAAADTYRRAIAADPKFLDPHLALGLLLARTNHPAEARTELLAATTVPAENAPLKARAYRALAHLDQTTNAEAARTELLAALKISPETPDDTLLTAELAEAANDLPAAESAYGRALKASPADPQATAALAHLLLRQQKPAEAESLLTAALTRHPNDPTLTAQLATVLTEQDKNTQAIPLVEKLHTANPGNPAVTRLLARLYDRDKQYDKADPLFASLVTPATADPTLLDDRAATLIHLKRYAEAQTLLKRALASPSAFPSKDDLGAAASHLAFAASQNNDPQTSLQALTLRATVWPQSSSSLFLTAIAYDKLRQVKLASQFYKQFLSVANGQYPDEEWEARHRLPALEHMK